MKRAVVDTAFIESRAKNTKMKKDRPTKRREEVRKLSDMDLFDELQRPTDNWKEDVMRETLCRILGRLISRGEK